MKRMAFIIALAGLVSQGWGGRVDVILQEPDVVYYTILIGDGRNDDTSRLYLLTLHNPEGDFYYTIRELTFSRGEWHIAQVCSLPHIGVGGILRGGMFLAQGRNDGINRLYVTSDSSVLEYTFSKGRWEDTLIVSYSKLLSSLIAAPWRNDDTIRLYAKIPWRPRMIEMSYSGGKWITKEIEGVEGFPIGAGEGRNDDTIRLYTCGYEITYMGEKEIRAERISESGVWCIGIGEGRGDDTVRLYGSCVTTIDDAGEIWEFTFRGGRWDSTLVDRYPFLIDVGPIPMRVGVARHDGHKRLYFIGYKRDTYPRKGGLYEYTFNNGEWWWEFVPFPESSGKRFSKSESSLGKVINGVCPLAIGKVGDDDTSRVYCIASAGLVAVNMEATGIEERSPSENTSISLSLFPNPSYGKIKICVYTIFPGKLKLYNSLGQLVKEFYVSEKRRHTLFWDGTDRYGKPVKGGVYFCILKTPRGAITKKLVLLGRKEAK